MNLLPPMPTETFCTRFLTVQDRFQNFVPAVPMPGQLRFFRACEAARNPSTGAFRAVHLKARRSGGTAAGLMMITQDICMTGTTKAAIVLHEERVTQRTLATLRTILEMLPDRDIPELGWTRSNRPVIDGDAQDYISFKNCPAIVFISSARAAAFGAGDDISFFLWSEVAKVEKKVADRIVKNAILAVTPNGKVIWDSTPDEINGDYYPMLWRRAKRPGSGLVAVFNPWYMVPDYRAGSADDWESLGPLWKDEVVLKAKGLGADRMHFRRAMCEELDVADPHEDGVGEMMFKVQYPEDEVSCFTGIRGKPYFDPRIVTAMMSRADRGRTVDQWDEPKEQAA